MVHRLRHKPNSHGKHLHNVTRIVPHLDRLNLDLLFAWHPTRLMPTFVSYDSCICPVTHAQHSSHPTRLDAAPQQAGPLAYHVHWAQDDRLRPDIATYQTVTINCVCWQVDGAEQLGLFTLGLKIVTGYDPVSWAWCVLHAAVASYAAAAALV